MVETGKLKLQRTQLENTIKDKKTEIGDLIYIAQKQLSLGAKFCIRCDESQ